MSAIVTPFPRARNGRFIRKLADRMASLTRTGGEQHLANQLGILAATLSKRGIAPAAINIELRAVECAVRAELWRAVITPGGAA